MSAEPVESIPSYEDGFLAGYAKGHARGFTTGTWYGVLVVVVLSITSATIWFLLRMTGVWR